jgi:pantoate--beta-alanine ligase
MGALHAGHLSLVELAKRETDVVVVSIFVNPRQFGRGEDFEKYPRQTDADIELLRDAGVDLVFVPGVEDIYPEGEAVVSLSVGPMGQDYEGASRPGHFDGVVTVVSRLFDIVKPAFAVFGKKDAQQLVVIREFAKEHYPEIRIVAGDVVREDDGVALSSRNRFLSPEQRGLAALFPGALQAAAGKLVSGYEGVEQVLGTARRSLSVAEGMSVDYVDLVDTADFSSSSSFGGREQVLVGAVRVGDTRLIDCVWFDDEQ